MLTNRSMPQAVVIPELAYRDVGEAVAWLCEAFGFEERLRIGNHRAQLYVAGGGNVIVTQRRPEQGAGSTGANEFHAPMRGEVMHSVMVRVADAVQHHAQAVKCDVLIIRPPTDYPYGERQYTAQDLGGHVWTFSQSLADIDPASWGGALSVRAPE